DAEDRAARAVLTEAPQAQTALSTRNVDLSHHSPARGPVRVGAFGDFAHEFVPEDSLKGGIALENFPVGAANPRQAHADQRFAALDARDDRRFGAAQPRFEISRGHPFDADREEASGKRSAGR